MAQAGTICQKKVTFELKACNPYRLTLLPIVWKCNYYSFQKYVAISFEFGLLANKV